MKKIYCILFLFLISFSYPFAQGYEEYDILKVGDKNPILQVTTIEGETIQFSGKIVWLTFFGIFCPPCKAELPELQKVWLKYKEHENFVIVVIGREETEEKLKEFVEKSGAKLIFVADPKREIYDQFAKGYIPRNYLISKEGNIVFQKVGYDKQEKLKKIVEELHKQFSLEKKTTSIEVPQTEEEGKKLEK